MNDPRTQREREFDQFIAEANADLESAPTELVVGQIAEVDAHLYRRLQTGDSWINVELEKFLAGHLDTLSRVRRAWQDWLRLYRYGLTLIESDEQESLDSPSARTTHRGPETGGK